MRLPDNLIAMIAAEAPLYAIADALDEIGHSWLEMVKAFMVDKTWEEVYTVSMTNLEVMYGRGANTMDCIKHRMRFPQCKEITSDDDHERRRVRISIRYDEFHMYQWAKQQWERIRDGKHFRAHPGHDGMLVADEDIPRGAKIAWSAYMPAPRVADVVQ